MPKIVKVLLISNLTLAVIAGGIAGYYFLSGGLTRGGQEALSNQNGSDNNPAATTVEGKDTQIIAKYGSSNDKEVKVILEGGKEALYSASELFLICKAANSDVYDSLVRNNARIIDPTYFIKTKDLETKLERGDEIELFLYLLESGEIPVKGIASLGC